MEERIAWAKQIRILFSPPEMLHSDGTINQTYFQYFKHSFTESSDKTILHHVTKTFEEQLQYNLKQLEWHDVQSIALLEGIQEFGCNKWSEIILNYLPNWDTQELVEQFCKWVGIDTNIPPNSATFNHEIEKAYRIVKHYYVNWRPLEFAAKHGKSITSIRDLSWQEWSNLLSLEREENEKRKEEFNSFVYNSKIVVEQQQKQEVSENKKKKQNTSEKKKPKKVKRKSRREEEEEEEEEEEAQDEEEEEEELENTDSTNLQSRRRSNRLASKSYFLGVDVMEEEEE